MVNNSKFRRKFCLVAHFWTWFNFVCSMFDQKLVFGKMLSNKNIWNICRNKIIALISETVMIVTLWSPGYTMQYKKIKNMLRNKFSISSVYNCDIKKGYTRQYKRCFIKITIWTIYGPFKVTWSKTFKNMVISDTVRDRAKQTKI